MRPLVSTTVVLAAGLLATACGRTAEKPHTERPAAATTPAAAAPRLDVVLVTVDTLRADATGFSGNARVKTPAMDRLAAAGRVFTNAHAHNVVTLPSHVNILTGLLPYVHGVRDNSGMRLADDVPTLATRLTALGYSTAAFVAAFPLDSRFGLAHGFARYDDRYGKGDGSLAFAMAERPGTAVVASALEWWKAQPVGRRFLFVHVFEPHAPYNPPPPFAKEYAKNPYLGEVAAADAALAPLFDALLAPGAPPALVVLTADHGESLGEHGEETHGLFAYEATLHVPLVVRAPELAAGRDARAARHIDIVPTVLAAVGAPDGKLPGRSLLTARDTAGDTTYFESLSAQLNRGWAPLTGILRGGLKYIDLPIRELYDLPGDPSEKTNLAATREADTRDLARALPPEAARGAPRSAPSAEETAKLRSLGYAVGSPSAKSAYTEADDPKNLIETDRQIHRIVDHYQRGRLDDAVHEAEALVAKRPGMPLALEHLAFLYQETGRLPQAVDVLKKAVAAAPDAAAIRVRLGMALAESGRGREAVEVLEKLRASRDPEALDALGIAYADAGEAAKAREAFGAALALDPENPVAEQNLGILCLREQKTEEAREHFTKALALNPRLPSALQGLGAAEAALGNVDGALQSWARLVELQPRNAAALYNIGILATKSGRTEPGHAALRLFLAAASPKRYAKEIAQVRALLESTAPGGPRR